MALFQRLRGIRHTPRDLAIAGAMLAVGVPVLVAAVALAGLFLFFFVFPPPVAIPEPMASSIARTSHIYAADGSLLAELHAEHNREPIAIDRMPKHLQDAAVAAEDARFFVHRGLDLHAVTRAAMVDLRARDGLQGGSTITQQYVKNAYVGSQRSLFRKVREALVAAQVERTYSKRKILERYLNTVYFGRGAYGVEAAGRTYFGKHAPELTVSESALLVGVIPSPRRFSPYEHPAESEIRRRYVVDRMRQEGFITSTVADQAKGERPLLVDPKASETVFKHPWFVDAVQRYLLSRYGSTKVFNGGLEVHTSLDPRVQEAAERVVSETLTSPTDPYAALVAVEPETGYVKALVGGRDYGRERYNIAIQGRRQPGSAFKPFVLVAGLENGITPDRRYRGPGTMCVKGWKPDCHVSNFDGAGFGSITVAKATANSVNTVFAQLVMDVGAEKVVDVAGRMGIPGPSWLPSRSGCKRSKDNPCGTVIEPVPALALGTEEVTPLEMASAFATLAAHGSHHEPKLVTKVLDAEGAVLESGPSPARRAVDAAVADNATAILEQVIAKGTGRRADIDRPAAGKTGTAQDHRNAWFVGYTPDLATAVWMGYRDSNSPLFNVRGVARVVGGSIPAQMWAEFMKLALADAPPTPFAEPAALGGGLRLPYRPPASPTGLPPEPGPDGGPAEPEPPVTTGVTPSRPSSTPPSAQPAAKPSPTPTSAQPVATDPKKKNRRPPSPAPSA
ncbi:MAG: PBP1A family penicillin-binding protein [Actinomycetota bacterium]